MVPGIFNSTSIPVLQEVISFSEQRHELLASNIANMDTPGYKTRDFNVETFQNELKQAIETRDTQRTALPGQVTENANPNDMRKVRDSLKHIEYHDGTDISMEHQVTELSKNQMMHNMAIAIMSSQFRLLETAISERV
jgi:flagellar basal-body rod protein FlgB